MLSIFNFVRKLLQNINLSMTSVSPRKKSYMRLGQIVNSKKNKKYSNLHESVWIFYNDIESISTIVAVLFCICCIFYFNLCIVYNFHTRYSCRLCTFAFRSRRNALNSRHFLWTFELSESYYCILHVSLEQNLLMFIFCVVIVVFCCLLLMIHIW